MSTFVEWSSWLYLGFFGGQRTKIQEVNRLFFIIQSNRLWVHRRYPWLTLAWQGDGRRYLTRFWPDFPKSHKFRFGRHTSKGDTGCVYSVHMDVYSSLSIYLLNNAPFSPNSLPQPKISVLQSVVSDATGFDSFSLAIYGKKVAIIQHLSSLYTTQNLTDTGLYTRI